MSGEVRNSEQQIEEHRQRWAEVAKENGWYKEPFFIQAWVNSDGAVVDSVSFDGLTKDFVLAEEAA